MFKVFGKMFTFWLSVDNRYRRLRDNPEKRPTTIRLGVQSIVQSVLSIVLVVLCIWGLVACFGALNSGSIEIGALILVCFAIVLLIGSGLIFLANGFIGALLYSIYQLKLNKRAVGWVALAIWLACVVGAIIFVIILIIK